MSKVGLFGIANVMALSVAIFHAYKLNGTFYSSCVYFTESKLSMIILGTFGLYCMFLVARIIKNFFLGPLRLIEREHITEYSWITLSETFLAMTIFKNDIDTMFIFAFATLMSFRVFHWILRDRIDYMEQVVQYPKNSIFKLASLLSILIFGCAFMVTQNVTNVVFKGPSMSILFANEYALTLVSLFGSAVRFSLNCMDTFHPDDPFEHRSTIIFYLDFFVDLFKLLIYTGFFGVVMFYYGLPIHIIRDLYVTVISFSKRVRDMINYHQIMSDLQTRYPDVTPEELSTCNDPTCIICREEMLVSVKKLPCGHFFHFKCLKSWLERQQVCPTCRKSVLEKPKNPSNLYPAEAREALDERNAHLQQSPDNLSRDTFESETFTLSPNTSSRSAAMSSSNHLLLSPVRRSTSLSSLHHVLLNENDAKDVLEAEDEAERLKIAADLERIGRRSRSPLSSEKCFSLLSTQTETFNTPLSPLSHVKSKINEVESLMHEHENILSKLRRIESEIIFERSMSMSQSVEKIQKSDEKEGDSQ